MLQKNDIPQHVAIIMDGNGRWARERGFARSQGHREGVKRAEEILEAADEAGVKFLTFFAFSAENWKRSQAEVAVLMRLLDVFLKRNLRRLMKHNMRLRVIGRKEPIPDFLWKRLVDSQAQTKENTGLTVILAFNYGARQEIVDAVRKIVKEVGCGKMRAEDINEDNFNNFLYTAGLPDPDMLIRTSGEVRISNFLLWQLSYAELYFPKVCWPDFKRENFIEAIREYQRRARRFGAA